MSPYSEQYPEVVEALRRIEEQLRDLAYEALRAAADGDPHAAAEEKTLLKARRAVERALVALRGLDGQPVDDL